MNETTGAGYTAEKTAEALNDARRALMRREGRTLLVYALLAAAAYGALLLARLAFGDKPHSLDAQILLWLRNPNDLAVPIGPAWLLEFARNVTTLGGWPVLTLFTLILSGFFILQKRWEVLILVAAAVIGESVIVEALKGYFVHERPAIVPHLVDISNYSFPSGHSASAAAVYLTLGALVSRATERRAVRVYVIAVAIFMTLIIGASRIYLGVHYPSDVLAGMSVGAFWAAAVWIAAYFLQARKR